MKWFICMFSVIAVAQTEPQVGRESAGPWRQQGNLVSIEIAKGQPIRIFVVGREEGKFNLDDVSLTIRRLKPYPARQLTANRSGDHFVISEPIEFSYETDLEVTAKVKNKLDVIKFKLPKKP